MKKQKQRSINKSTFINEFIRLRVSAESDVSTWDLTIKKIKEKYPHIPIKFIEEDLVKNGLSNPYNIHK